MKIIDRFASTITISEIPNYTETGNICVVLCVCIIVSEWIKMANTVGAYGWYGLVKIKQPYIIKKYMGCTKHMWASVSWWGRPGWKRNDNLCVSISTVEDEGQEEKYVNEVKMNYQQQSKCMKYYTSFRHTIYKRHLNSPYISKSPIKFRSKNHQQLIPLSDPRFCSCRIFVFFLLLSDHFLKEDIRPYFSLFIMYRIAYTLEKEMLLKCAT